MEFDFPSISVIFITFLVFVLKTVQFRKRSKATNLPPGPWNLPFIGNLHKLIGKLPHHVLRDMSKIYGPLMYLKLGQVPSIVISSPDIAEEVMKTNGVVFAHRPYVLASRVFHYDSTDIVFSPYGNYWRQMRKISTMELLSTKRVQGLSPIRVEEISNLIKSIPNNGEETINLSQRLFSLAYANTARAAFGKKIKNQEEFVSLVKEFSELASFNIADMFPSFKLLQVIGRYQLKAMQKKVEVILNDLMDSHREKMTATSSGKVEPQDDLLDVLLKVQKNDQDLECPLTDENVKAVILDIVVAGSETSSTNVEWALSEMIRNPRVMKKAQAEVRKAFGEKGKVDEASLPELKYLQAVIKETLRFHPSAPLLLPRASNEECEINGYVIPAKTSVYINAWAISHDPKHWAEPEEFKPERFLDNKVDFRGGDFIYIPFGAGKRSCPGISYALANIQLQLANLLYHFDWKLPGGMKPEDLEMTEAFGLTVRRKNQLYVIPTPYHHPSPAN